MEINFAIVFCTLLYKLACLAVGTLFCAFGYRLFKLGIWGNSGDLSAKFQHTSIVLKSAAPGTFFAVLGAVLVVVTVWHGLRFDMQSGGVDSAATAAPPALPDH